MDLSSFRLNDPPGGRKLHTAFLLLMESLVYPTHVTWAESLALREQYRKNFEAACPAERYWPPAFVRT